MYLYRVVSPPIAQVHLIEPALVVSGVKVTVFPSMTGLPPSPFEYRIEITPLATVTEVTYFEVIEAAGGRPAVWLSAGRDPFEVYDSATASFAAAARLKPSLTFVRMV